MTRRNFMFTLLGCSMLACLGLIPGEAAAVEKMEPDPKASALVTSILTALQTQGDEARLQAVLPLVHKSLIAKDGKDLAPEVKNFSYKKASSAAGLYKNPASITEVQKGNAVTVGFRETAERGRKDKYFVAKKDGQAGRPAPIVVFWPESGAEPKVIDFGSL